MEGRAGGQSLARLVYLFGEVCGSGEDDRLTGRGGGGFGGEVRVG